MDQLGEMDCQQFFSYFTEHVPSSAGPAHLDFLRSLPIFPSLVPGRRVALNNGPFPAATCPSLQLAAAVGNVSALPQHVQVHLDHCLCFTQNKKGFTGPRSSIYFPL